MSAWLFTDEKIHRVVVAFRCGIVGFARGQGIETIDANALGAQLRAMNCAAVFARYGEQLDVAEQYRFVMPPPFSVEQAFKSLRCFRYQCSEGDVPERWTLYSDVCKAISFYADLLGYDEEAQRWTKRDHIEAYEAAEWN